MGSLHEEERQMADETQKETEEQQQIVNPHVVAPIRDTSITTWAQRTAAQMLRKAATLIEEGNISSARLLMEAADSVARVADTTQPGSCRAT